MQSIRTYFVVVLITGLSSVAGAQNDTTEYLFRKAKYSYLQYTVGYSPMLFSNDLVAHGFSCSIVGIVFNEKVSIGLDVDGFAKTPPLYINTFPHISSCVFISLNVEPLIRPKKIINFSVPVKIGYGSAQIYEIAPPGYVVVSNPEFMVVQPGAVAWINLFKSLSLGAGGSYRVTINSHPETFDKFSGFSGYALIRFKLYTRELQQKMSKPLRNKLDYL